MSKGIGNLQIEILKGKTEIEKREIDLGRFHYADEGTSLFAPLLSGPGPVDI